MVVIALTDSGIILPFNLEVAHKTDSQRIRPLNTLQPLATQTNYPNGNNYSH